MKIEPQIKIGELEVLSNGVVISYENKDITFDIRGLIFTIQFVSDKNIKDEGKLKGVIDKDNPKHLFIRLINFNSSLGRGLINPVEVGNFDGKKILFQFKVSKLSETATRIFEYTWLTKDVENDEKR